MTAQDYPVSFPYGATDAPYSPSRPHRGNDRACPEGTPIVVAGTQIGLVGSTGLASGSHLHTQAGTDIGCQNTFNPTPLEFKPGKVVNTGVGSQWGNFVTVQVGNQYITYCHLQRIDVSVGQELNGSMAGRPASSQDVNNLLGALWDVQTNPNAPGYDATARQNDHRNHDGKPLDEVWDAFYKDPRTTEAAKKRFEALNAPREFEQVPVTLEGKQLYKKKEK